MYNRRQAIQHLSVAAATCALASPAAAQESCEATYQLTLADGRRIGVAEYGSPGGVPVIYLHGLPASKLEARAFHHQADMAKCRIISVDRPGIGDSDAHVGRRIEDWPRDVAEIVNQLQLNDFFVIGFSSGGPYALRCAIEFAKPEFRTLLGSARLQRVVATCCLAPPTSCLPKGVAQPVWKLVHRHPSLASRLLRFATRGMKRNPDRLVNLFAKQLSEPSRRVSRQPFYRQVVIDTFLDAVRCGPCGLLDDARLLACPWNLPADQCQIPVDLWYGDCDRITPPPVARYWAQALPAARLFMLPGEGHYSIVVGDNASKILTTSVVSAN